MVCHLFCLLVRTSLCLGYNAVSLKLCFNIDFILLILLGICCDSYVHWLIFSAILKNSHSLFFLSNFVLIFYLLSHGTLIIFVYILFIFALICNCLSWLLNYFIWSNFMSISDSFHILSTWRPNMWFLLIFSCTDFFFCIFGELIFTNINPWY